MKDDEIIKILVDLEGDNIKQEREIFKHIAIVSSAIVGVFVFNGDFVVSNLVKYGLIGFVSVIILSVALLFIIIHIERNRARQALESMREIKKVRSDLFENTLKSVFNKDIFSLAQECWKEKDLMKFFCGATPTGLAVYKQITDSDKQINKAKRRSGKKRSDRLFTFLSFACIGVFLASLIMVLFEIIY